MAQTTMSLSTDTRDRLERFKLVPMETYDYLLNRLMDKLGIVDTKSSDDDELTTKDSQRILDNMSEVEKQKFFSAGNDSVKG